MSIEALDPATRCELRSPRELMRLERLGSFHQSRLSFMRVLTRRLAREAWRFTRGTFALDAAGVGHAVYTVAGPKRSYSLVAFSHDLPDEKRSDRVIADAWDATFVLYDGIPSHSDIERLQQEVPYQEAGRLSGSELCLSRANRSVRLWEHVVSRLAAGLQPDTEALQSTGYLMRTTAVYGSGKFGACDRAALEQRPEFAEPFQVEMLSVYLIRAFVLDLVEHLAAARGGASAVRLHAESARDLGIGNSTGLGMAPFVLNHPELFNHWVHAREEAIRRVRTMPTATREERSLFLDVLEHSRSLFASWHTDHAQQSARIEELVADLDAAGEVLPELLQAAFPWNRLHLWTREHLGIEAQECLASLMLEPYAEQVDDLCAEMAHTEDNRACIRGNTTVADMRHAIESCYDWALRIDWQQPAALARAWYVSQEKLEPRLGERFEEPIEPFEQPLAPGRDAVAFYHELSHWPDNATLAEVLLERAQFRHIALRIQIVSEWPYAEIRDNTVAADMQAIDLLRCKLSFFGATHFDPRSDRWVRIRLFAGAPYPADLSPTNADRWVYQSSTNSTEHG